MAPVFHTRVSLADIKFAKVNRTFLFNGPLTRADTGKAVSLHPAAPNTVRLAGNNETIIGYLEIVEPERGTCTVALHFTEELPILAGQTVAVGDTVVGAGDGFVRRRMSGENPAPDHSINYVVEVAGGKAVVVKA